MIKTTFYLGLNDKDTKQQHFTTDYVLVYVKDCLSDKGATVQVAEGIYKGHTETTIIATIFENVIDELFYERLFKELKNEFNQECILVERSEVSAQFV